MYIICNAIKNLKRNSGRNLLMGFITFIVIVLASISIVINTTTEKITQEYKVKYGSEVHITNQNIKVKNTLTSDLLLSFGKSNLLSKTDYLAKISYVAKGLKAIDDQEDNNQTVAPKGYLLGSNHEKINNDFESGVKKIVKGKMYQSINEAIISKQLAELNNLDIGQAIILHSHDRQDEEPLKLIISGIYDDLSIQSQQNLYGVPLLNPKNEIYTSLQTVIKTDLYKSNGSLEMKLFLKDPHDLEKLKEELKEKGLPNQYSVTTDERSYQAAIAPIEDLADASIKMMIAIFTFGIFMIILLSLISLRERKYEIGILRAIGMKKQHIIVGFITEMSVITGICLVLGIVGASLASQAVSNMLLATTSEIKVEFTPLAFGYISCVALALTILSSIAGTVFITRYEPRKILSE